MLGPSMGSADHRSHLSPLSPVRHRTDLAGRSPPVVACYRPLWELAFELELLCPADSGRSRKRDHSVFDWLLLHVAASLLGGVRKGARELSNPELWAMLQQAVIRAWPHSTGFRLGDQPISRTQYWYFRAHHLSGEMVEQMVSKARDAGARTGLWMGLFDPAAGSLARPDKTQMVAGDATWIETLFRVDPDEGEGNSHFDPDAIQYHHSQQDRPARGHKAMILLARHPYRSERVILAAEVAPPGTTEGNWFCDRIEGLVECHPQIAPGLNAAVYDMAVGAAHRDRLLDMGIVPIGKIRRTKTGDPAAMNIGVHIFANNKTGESDELGNHRFGRNPVRRLPRPHRQSLVCPTGTEAGAAQEKPGDHHDLRGVGVARPCPCSPRASRRGHMDTPQQHHPRTLIQKQAPPKTHPRAQRVPRNHQTIPRPVRTAGGRRVGQQPPERPPSQRPRPLGGGQQHPTRPHRPPNLHQHRCNLRPRRPHPQTNPTMARNPHPPTTQTQTGQPADTTAQSSLKPQVKVPTNAPPQRPPTKTRPNPNPRHAIHSNQQTNAPSNAPTRPCSSVRIEQMTSNHQAAGSNPAGGAARCLTLGERG